MSFKHLEDYEKARAAEKRAAAEAEARKALKRAVRDVLPKGAKPPKRPRGRAPIGGLTRKEVKALKVQAREQLAAADGGLASLSAEIKHTVVVILKIDGVLGTEPWRAAHGAHGGLIAANARLRYLENALRLLDDLRQSQGQRAPSDRLLEGVIDAETT